MSNTNKMDVSTIYEMFETIKSKLDKQKSNPVEPIQIDLSAVNAMAEQLENVIVEIKKPSKVEYRHTIDIRSSKVFISLIIMVLIIIGLSYVVGEQRRNTSQYKDNDLKYRYIKMQGQTNEENLYRLEQQFQHKDSVRIIRSRVTEFERLVRLKAERIERARLNEAEMERLEKEVEIIRVK